MSAMDYEITNFFNKKVSLSSLINSYKARMKAWETLRVEYPDWITKRGVHIKIADLEDSHLNNLIAFVTKRDKENKTHWIDILKEEKRYRELEIKINKMNEELGEMKKVSYICL